MSISISRYVLITSAVAGAQTIDTQKLIGRRFVDNPLLPIGTILTVRQGGAEDYFGSGPEAAFANQYFSYISPPPASQAPALQFASIAASSRPARLYAGELTQTLAQLKTITTGALDISVYGTTYNVTAIDLSTATDLDDVASTITAEITAEAGGAVATVTYNALRGAFEVVASSVVDDGIIDITSNVGVDVGAATGFLAAARIVSPASNAQSPKEALMASEDVSDSFGSATFATAVTLDQAKELSAYVSAANVKYMVLYSVPDKPTASTWYAGLSDYASTGLILNGTPGEYKEALPQAIMAATDYTRRNAAVNYMFRQSGGGLTPDVRNDVDADYYDNLRVNYYGQTATAGQDISFFQRGVLMGGGTAPTDMGVHANEQWLKAYLRARLMALLVNTVRVPANLDGRGMVLAVVQEGVDRAIFNGTILLGKTLTALQQVSITQITGDPLAYHDIEIGGYWADAQIVQETVNGTEQYICKYTLVYAKGDSIRKVEGSHNLI